MINSVNLNKNKANAYQGIEQGLNKRKSKGKEGKMSSRRKINLREQKRDKVNIKNKNHKSAQQKSGTKIGKVINMGGRGKYKLDSPVRGGTTYISSRFGEDRGSYMHKGLDIDGKAGDNIYAAKKGEVVFSGHTERGGNEVVINHENGLTTKYSHLDELNVEQGDKVSNKTVIGTMGSTGQVHTDDSDGDIAHLHYEVMKDGKNIDPEAFLDAEKTKYKRGDYGSGSCSGSGDYGSGSCSSSGDYGSGSCSSSGDYDSGTCSSSGDYGSGSCSSSGDYGSGSCSSSGDYDSGTCSSSGDYDSGTCSSSSSDNDTDEIWNNWEDDWEEENKTNETDKTDNKYLNKLKELTDNLEEDVNNFNDAKDNYSDAKDEFQKNKSMMHWRLTKNHAEDMLSEAFAIKSSREDLVDYVDNTNGVPIPEKAEDIYSFDLHIDDLVPEKPTSNQEIKNKIDDLIENDLRPACSDFKKLDNQKFKPLLSDYKSGEIENKYKVDTWEDLNGFAEDLKSKTSTIYGIVREVKNLEDKLSTSGSCSGSSSGYDLSGIIPDKAEKINQQGSSYDFGIGENPVKKYKDRIEILKDKINTEEFKKTINKFDKNILKIEKGLKNKVDYDLSDLEDFAENAKGKAEELNSVYKSIRGNEQKIRDLGGEVEGTDMPLSDKAEKLAQRGYDEMDLIDDISKEIINNVSYDKSRQWEYGDYTATKREMKDFLIEGLKNSSKIFTPVKIVDNIFEAFDSVTWQPRAGDTLTISTELNGGNEGKIDAMMEFKFKSEVKDGDSISYETGTDGNETVYNYEGVNSDGDIVLNSSNFGDTTLDKLKKNYNIDNFDKMPKTYH